MFEEGQEHSSGGTGTEETSGAVGERKERAMEGQEVKRQARRRRHHAPYLKSMQTISHLRNVNLREVCSLSRIARETVV